MSTRQGLRRRLQQLAFATLYRTGRWVYDPLTALLFGGEWDVWRRSVLPDLPRGPILDLGCGTGALLEELRSAGRPAVGIDESRSMLAAAAARFEPGPPPLARGDIRALPFLDRRFAACVATFPSGAILERQTLDEVARVLRPGGVFVVVLSGEMTETSVLRAPIRLALRLFYGRRDTSQLPPDDLLAHPRLPGRWERRPSPRGYATVWRARLAGSAGAAR